MPQTRDTAPQQPAANGSTPPVTETRVDAAHSIGDAVSAPLLADLSLAELPLAAFCLWIAGRVEFRRQRRAEAMARLMRQWSRRPYERRSPSPEGPDTR